MSRVKPLEKPYSAENQALFDLAMPAGMEPLELFRTLARSARIFPRFMRGGILDKGPVPIRDREIVIHRTTARCGAEYEWGVHANAFGRPLGLGEDVLRATVEGDAEDPSLDARQATLFRLCDELHDDSSIGNDTWTALRGFYDDEQILELIYTAGFYHTVSFLVNGLRIPNEPGAASFSEWQSADD